MSVDVHTPLDLADIQGNILRGYAFPHCIGAPLVRLAAPVALGKLMELDELAVDGLAQWQTDPYLRGRANLPLSFAA